MGNEHFAEIARLRAEVERLTREQRRFPIQGGPSIPWAAIAPHEHQAMLNHGGQSLERLAQRGGLGMDEAVAVLEDRKWRSMPDAEARARLVELTTPFEALLARAEAAERERDELRDAHESKRTQLVHRAMYEQVKRERDEAQGANIINRSAIRMLKQEIIRVKQEERNWWMSQIDHLSALRLSNPLAKLIVWNDERRMKEREEEKSDDS